jgi:hypothetical protein
MTKGEKAAKTRKKKEQKMLDAMGFERKAPTIRRKRKPMSEEQKAAAAERLAKAREARGHDGSASVHESIRDLPEDHSLHWKKVREWIKDNEQALKGMKHLKDSKDWKERSEYLSLQTYIHNMKSYLNNGVWLDFRYGERGEHRVTHYCVAMSYHPNGEPNRSYGTFYPDINQVWTKELEELWYGKDYDARGVVRKDKLLDEEEFFDDGGRDGDED